MLSLIDDQSLGTATRLVKAGFAVYGMDYEGHGKSGGLNGYIKNFDGLVHDVSSHYSSICGNNSLEKYHKILQKQVLHSHIPLFLECSEKYHKI